VTVEGLPGDSCLADREATAGPDALTREVLRLFDTGAAGWPARYAPGGSLVGRLASLSTAVNWHARAGDRVLDLGCGTGELARTLASAGFRVAGCDISPQMLRRAARDHAASDRDGCARWVRLEPGWRSLPFVAAAFDVVVAASVLEYVTEPGAVLRECARVLRPGGVVLYTVPDLRHPVRWAEWFVQRLALVTGPPPKNGSRRWNDYRAYLRASLHRHRFRWWLAVSGSVGLRPVLFPANGARSSLRLLTFCCANESPADEGGPE
jgi:SAM-dependent methyltransferase